MPSKPKKLVFIECEEHIPNKRLAEMSQRLQNLRPDHQFIILAGGMRVVHMCWLCRLCNWFKKTFPIPNGDLP